MGGGLGVFVVSFYLFINFFKIKNKNKNKTIVKKGSTHSLTLFTKPCQIIKYIYVGKKCTLGLNTLF